MNVACSQCSAKYAINDDRVKGRKVRIKCKRCGNAFVVDGTAEVTTDAPPVVRRSATPNPGAVTLDAAAASLWMVAITDDDTREMTTDQVIDAYATRTIDQYTYLWREGMADWQAPFEISEIAALLKEKGFQVSEDALPPPGAGAGGVVWREPGRASSPLNPALSEYQDDESDNDVTRTLSRSTLEGLEPSHQPHPTEEQTQNDAAANDAAASIENAQGLAPPLATNEPFFGSPARAKVSDRPSGVDLFGGFPKSPEPEPQAASATTEDSTLTGARHESSVLFSLNALVSSEEAKTAKRTSRREQPSDDAFLSSSAGPPSDPIATLTANVVDPMLAPSSPSVAPPLPSIAPVAPVDALSIPPKRSATSGVLLTLLGVVIALGGVGGAVALGLVPGVTFSPVTSEAPPPMPTSVPEPTPSAVPSSTAPAAPSAVPSAPVAVPSTAPSVAAIPSAVPAPSASASTKIKPAESAAAAIPTAPAPAAPAAPSTATAAPAAVPATPTAAPAAPAATPDPAAAAPAPAPAAGGFSTDAAKAALASAAANATANCKVPGTPAGSSKVTVTFVPSGKATQALVAGDFAGTPAGSCIARVFRGAQIPAFSGDSVTVTKTVTLH